MSTITIPMEARGMNYIATCERDFRRGYSGDILMKLDQARFSTWVAMLVIVGICLLMQIPAFADTATATAPEVHDIRGLAFAVIAIIAVVFGAIIITILRGCAALVTRFVAALEAANTRKANDAAEHKRDHH